MLSHGTCQVLAAVLSPLGALGSCSHGRCSPGRGQYSVLKPSPVKPRLGPKLSGVQAGRGSLNIFGLPASLYSCLCLLGVLILPAPHCVPPARGKAQLVPSICALQGLSAGHGSSNSNLLLYPKQDSRQETRTLTLGSQVSISKYGCV